MLCSGSRSLLLAALTATLMGALLTVGGVAAKETFYNEKIDVAAEALFFLMDVVLSPVMRTFNDQQGVVIGYICPPDTILVGTTCQPKDEYDEM